MLRTWRPAKPLQSVLGAVVLASPPAHPLARPLSADGCAPFCFALEGAAAAGPGWAGPALLEAMNCGAACWRRRQQGRQQKMPALLEAGDCGVACWRRRRRRTQQKMPRAAGTVGRALSGSGLPCLAAGGAVVMQTAATVGWLQAHARSFSGWWKPHCKGSPWLTSNAAQNCRGAQHRDKGRGLRKISAVLLKVLTNQQQQNKATG